MKKRMAVCVLLVALAPGAWAQSSPRQWPHPAQRERVFMQASELMPWCRQQAEAHFAGLGIATYQWTSSYRQDGKLLVVDGKLRAHDVDVPVHCRVAQNASERYASVRIDAADG